MKFRIGLFVFLASATAALAAASSSAALSEVKMRYVQCSYKHHDDSTGVLTRPLGFRNLPGESSKYIYGWWDYVGETFNPPPDELRRGRNMEIDCQVLDAPEQFKAWAHNYPESEWKQIDFPVEFAGVAPKKRDVVDSPSPGLVIQDAKPTHASPAELAEIRLQGQREDAARRVKAAAEHARTDAELQARIKKFFEEAKKRGNAQ